MTNKTILTGVIAFFSYAILLLVFTACTESKPSPVSSESYLEYKCPNCGEVTKVYVQD